MNSFRLCFFMAILLVALTHSAPAQQPAPTQQPQFIYLLRLAPRLHAKEAWTAEDKAAVERHFVRLQDAAKKGDVILAGRTREPDDKTFGIVVFQNADEAAARKFMETDPAVVAGIMTAELHPFAVAVEQTKP